MKGSDIYEIYDTSKTVDHGVYMQNSGLKVYYKIDKKNHRTVLDRIEYKGEKLDPNREYLVCTNSFLAGGGDGYVMFKRGKLIKKLDGFMRDALTNYIAKRGTISPTLEDRLIFE
jgi:2',3'-cyclic-nucleotide 2'-phosphodiesterase (5'-nucleotidase family)